jgi:hypothetical protein
VGICGLHQFLKVNSLRAGQTFVKMH